jgi:chromosome partitioning protein
MKIISIANQKGGCGKTTTAINLASALSLNGKKVLLIDLDAQAHASLGLDVESQDSLYNVISKLTPRKLRIENIIKRVEDSFDIAPSNILVGTLEQELSDEIGREIKLSEILSTIKDQYDYILIDCSPSLGILTINAIRASDEVIIPAETSRFSMQGVEHIIEIITLVKSRLDHNVKYRVLVTMFDSRLRHSFSMLDTFRKKFGEYLYDTIIHVNVKLKESAVMGKPVAYFDKYSRGAKDYFTLAKELILLAKQEAGGEDISGPGSETEVKQEKAATGKTKELKSTGGRVREEIDQTEAEETGPGLPRPFSKRMQETVQEEAKGLFPTRFAIDVSGAKSVYVTGSFNDWSLDDHCRLKEVDGQWRVDIDLKPGFYKYQFIVDGVWKEDPNNPRRERNSFGDINSLVEVKAPVAAGDSV